MVKWLFFDLGSTLIDESECAEYRLQELLKQKNSPCREILEQRMLENASQNRLPYKDTAKEFGLETIKWPKHLEKLYVEVPGLLKDLHNKYKLGIIANQSPGTEKRLLQYEIHHYFDVIIASAEEGISKPEPEIFIRALQRAKCKPEESYMIGDRLDNDIEPAAQLGMHTIWVRQGSFKNGDLRLISHKPDKIIEHIGEIRNCFSSGNKMS